MSVGKTADDDNVLIFTKKGVTVYKEEDVFNNMPDKTHYHTQMIWMWLVPHTINPSSQAMATAQTNKEIQ